MNIARVGKTIAHLRKRAGLTQKELAEQIGISDKAVSKWERGISLPDISYLQKLAAILGTDSDSLLVGDMIRSEREWKGLLLLEDNCCGIGSDTIIYDKPLVYYLISFFLLAGIDRIMVLCPKQDECFLRDTLGNGEELGIELTYRDITHKTALLESKDAFFECRDIMVVFGRRLIYGAGLTRFFQRAMTDRKHPTLLVNPAAECGEDERVWFDEEQKVVQIAGDAKGKAYNCCRNMQILFVPRHLLTDACYSLKIIKNERNSSSLSLYAEKLDRGFVDFSLEDRDEVMEAAEFVRTVQKASGRIIYCIEEIAWRRGMIDIASLRRIEKNKNCLSYGNYVLSLTK